METKKLGKEREKRMVKITQGIIEKDLFGEVKPKKFMEVFLDETRDCGIYNDEYEGAALAKLICKTGWERSSAMMCPGGMALLAKSDYIADCAKSIARNDSRDLAVHQFEGDYPKTILYAIGATLLEFLSDILNPHSLLGWARPDRQGLERVRAPYTCPRRNRYYDGFAFIPSDKREEFEAKVREYECGLSDRLLKMFGEVPNRD